MSKDSYYVPPAGRALLDAVAFGETRGDYALRYGDRPGHGSITDFSAFPTGVHNGNNVAGKYQFKPATWNTQKKKLGLTDFSPESQDAAAWDLMKTLYSNRFNGRDLEADLESGDKTSDVIRSLRSTWPSLPGGSQEVTSSAKFDSVYSQALATHSAETQAPDASTALGQVNLLAGSASQGIDAHAANVGKSATPDATAFTSNADFNPDYPLSIVQHGNDVTDPTTLDNPGPVTSSDLDPFMNAAINHLMASAGPLVHTGSTNGEINASIAQAGDSTYRPDQIIRVETINPDVNDFYSGVDVGNPNNPHNRKSFDPLPAPLPLTAGIGAPSHGTIDASGSVIPNPTASGSSEITGSQHERHNPSVQDGMGAVGSAWDQVTKFFGPQNDSRHDTRDTSGRDYTGGMGELKTTSSPAASEVMSTPRPSIPDLQVPTNSSGSPDDRSPTPVVPPVVHFIDPNTIASHNIGSIASAVGAGIDPLTASVVTAQGAAPTVIKIPVVKPIIAPITPSQPVLPDIPIPSYDIGTVRDRNGNEHSFASTGATVNGIRQGPGQNGTAGEGTIKTNPTKYGETSADRQAYQQSRQDFLKQWNVT